MDAIKVLVLDCLSTPVRITSDDNDRLWFAAVDIGKALGLTNIRSVLANHPNASKGVQTVYTPGGPQTLQ